MKDLERFVEAQASMYAVALKEIEQGCKQSHWIWFIFPQHEALGYSSMAKFYGIRDLEEARAYLAHSLLGRVWRRFQGHYWRIVGRRQRRSWVRWMR